jgi:hypothetical protein
MEDSYTAPPVGQSGDYPINVNFYTTLTGHQFRVNAGGNIVVDKSNSPNRGRVYIVFADNADGQNSREDPVTNTNIFLAYSDDGGQTWSGGDGGSDTDLSSRIRVDNSANSDQLFPWGDVGPDGTLHVLYTDGRTDRDLYDITIASSATGVPPFSFEVVSQAPSNPDNGFIFRAGVPDCFNCETFIGDYNGLAIDTLGRVHGVWTDMRRTRAPFGNVQDAFYARR